MHDNESDIRPLTIKSGINRDGTRFTHQFCTDGQWVRFFYGRPRKIGGYRMLYDNIQEVPRGACVISKDGFNNYFFGTASFLYKLPVDNTGSTNVLVDITPAGFAVSPNNTWQFDQMFDINSTALVVFAHGGQNLAEIDSSVDTDVYYGDASLNTPLVTTGEAVSGGVCCLHPYLFIYGNDGLVQWANAGTVDFTTGVGMDAGSARITGSKVVKGVSIKSGGGYSPAGLFWSLDTLHRVYYVGGDTIFKNEMIGETKLLSSSAVVEYDGLYFWPCSDRRWSYWNGYIRDLPNDMNQDFFYNNLNWQYRQKVWGEKVSQYNEIWWHYPSGNSTECDRTIIFNVKDNTFYDSVSYRGCGVASGVFPYPVFFGNTIEGTTGYRVWQHEYGYDQVVNQTVNAIPSFFETPMVTYVDQGPGMDSWIYLEWFEPDFLQVGDMTLEIVGEDYPQSDVTEVSDSFTIPENSPKIDIRLQRRLLRLRITSNTAGGFYYMGRPLMKISPGIKRQFNNTPS